MSSQKPNFVTQKGKIKNRRNFNRRSGSFYLFSERSIESARSKFSGRGHSKVIRSPDFGWVSESLFA